MKVLSELMKIIEKLNDIYGWVILFSVFAGVMHFSVNLFTIFRTNGTVLEQILCALNFAWFGCTLWSTAQVYEEVRSCKLFYFQ